VTPPPSAATAPASCSRRPSGGRRKGNAGLVDRYFKSLGRPATPVTAGHAFLVGAAQDATEQQGWRAFVESALGFVPAIGAHERVRWQGFLQARYVTIDQVNEQHGTAYADFNTVPLPRMSQPTWWPVPIGGCSAGWQTALRCAPGGKTSWRVGTGASSACSARTAPRGPTSPSSPCQMCCPAPQLRRPTGCSSNASSWRCTEPHTASRAAAGASVRQIRSSSRSGWGWRDASST